MKKNLLLNMITCATLLLCTQGAQGTEHARIQETPKEHWNAMLIHEAARGNLDAFMLALAQGADVNARDKHGDTALMYAAKNGHRPMIEALLARRANPHITNEGGWTALIAAATYNQLDSVLALHDAGMLDVNRTINFRDSAEIEWNRVTALHIATCKNHLPMVKLLLDLGANPLQRDDDCCAPHDYKTTEEISTLLKQRARELATKNLFNACALGGTGDVDAAKQAIADGADVNYHNAAFESITPLGLALSKRNKKLITLLIDSGASKEDEVIEGLTALNYAKFLRDEGIIKLFDPTYIPAPSEATE